ncbi:hypothetical protein ADEAN_000108300 [Angomonas deanei]|uniref:Uncharacterized protein n=1 Tax=Angomonas deanei TaxID=59799 RepID=A0A7G2C1P1_9TRYP|nr:hypothetical protein ADEAN_000108300 [Angomonas deanei]
MSSPLHINFHCSLVPPPVKEAMGAFDQHLERLFNVFTVHDRLLLRSITIPSYTPYFTGKLTPHDPTMLSPTQYTVQQVQKKYDAHCQRCSSDSFAIHLALTGTRDTHSHKEKTEGDKESLVPLFADTVVSSLRGATREGVRLVVEDFMKREQGNEKGRVVDKRLFIMKGVETEDGRCFKDFRTGTELMSYIERDLSGYLWGAQSTLIAGYPQGHVLSSSWDIKQTAKQESGAPVFTDKRRFLQFVNDEFTNKAEGNVDLPPVSHVRELADDAVPSFADTLRTTVAKMLRRIDLVLLLHNYATYDTVNFESNRVNVDGIVEKLQILSERSGATPHVTVVPQALGGYDLREYSNFVKEVHQQASGITNVKYAILLGLIPPLLPMHFCRMVLQLNLKVHRAIFDQLCDLKAHILQLREECLQTGCCREALVRFIEGVKQREEAMLDGFVREATKICKQVHHHNCQNKENPIDIIFFTFNYASSPTVGRVMHNLIADTRL